MNAIRLTDVDFAYRKDRRLVQVLNGFSLDVDAGERVALLGESGCGKSTVLSLISGLNVPRSGSVEVLGTDVSALDNKGRAQLRLNHVAQVYQDFQLLPMLTAQENVALLLQLKGNERNAALDHAAAALADVGLGRRLGHLPGELSGGEQQRVSIARAVVAKPLLLLADEPTGSLDADKRDEILDLMLERLSGTTTVLVTHDPEVAARADRVARMT